MRKSEKMTAALLWRWYTRGDEHHRMRGLYEKTKKAHRFFRGEQWYGVESGGEELPFYNFIQPVVEHKVASVCMNTMSIQYAPMEHAGALGPGSAQICQRLTAYAARQWERLKMDKLCWEVVKNACIAGDSYLYFHDGDCQAQVVDTCDLFLGDETCPDVQKQPYLLIARRQTVGEVRKAARRYGLGEAEVQSIVPDDGPLDRQEREEEWEHSDTREEEQLCTTLLAFWRDEDGVVCCTRGTRDVLYQKPVRLYGGGRGLSLYPIAAFRWMGRRGSSRGDGEVTPLIPNQIETNKMLARRLMNAKMTAFSRLVYNADKVLNKEALEEVGAAIKVRDMQANAVTDIVSYLGAAPMSPDAQALAQELVQQTRDLAGAGDAALGQVNPEKASGAAIIAVRDQAALPLNEQIADFRQFVEDVASIWFELWAAYYPAELSRGIYALSGEELRRLRVEIRIDVSPNSPYSRYAQEQALENLFQKGVITFEEYVAALDENAAAPKQKLEDIIQARKSQGQGQRESRVGTAILGSPAGQQNEGRLG